MLLGFLSYKEVYLMDTNINKLVSSYLNWLKSNIIVKRINGHFEITTPFLDRYNDHLQIYIRNLDDERFLLTDDGYIISELKMSGLDLHSKKRREILEELLNGYHVKKNNYDELYVEAALADFPQKKHFLLQAMMAVDDMFLTTWKTVSGLFYEDVKNFLNINKIHYKSEVKIVGRTGFTHNFDFVIPSSKKTPERVLKAINNPVKEKVTNLLFSWDDTRPARKEESILYAVLNDSKKKISLDIVSALEEYKVKILRWSKRQDFVSELSA